MSQPLADRLRPKTLDDIVGQAHLLSAGKPLRRIIETGKVPNLIFYGPSGTGKTTLARIIADSSGKRLHKLNGTNTSLSEIKEVVSEIGTLESLNGILLYLDEIQYLNKKQQQSLLEYIETGEITLIASTTENPYFYIYNAILSRSTVFEFKPVSDMDIEKALARAVTLLSQEEDLTYQIEEGVLKRVAQSAGGDVRKALGTLEMLSLVGRQEEHIRVLTLADTEDIAAKFPMRYDKDGDEHYDMLSALQKSIRGSDENAALYYLARILMGGDLIGACRRLLVIAAEDIGLAYPQAMPITKACVDSALQLGLPEARIPLAEAAVLLATAPKSNSAYAGITAAMEAITQGALYSPPRNLQNKHYDGAEVKQKGQFYLYPHDFENHYVEQSYLPDELEGTVFFEYGSSKLERSTQDYWDKVKQRKSSK